MPVRQHPEVWRNVTGGRQDAMGKYLTIHRRQDSLQTHVPDGREPCSQRSGTAVPAVGNHVPSGRELRYLAPLQAADPHRFGKLPAGFQTSLLVESCVRSPERQKSPKGFSAPAGNDRNPRAHPPSSCQPLIEALEKQTVPSGQVRPASDFHNSLSPSGQPIASVRIPATAGIYHRHGRCRASASLQKNRCVSGSLSYTEQGSRGALCEACLWDSNTTEAACAVSDSPEDNERSPAPLRLPGLETKRNRACSVLPSAVYLETAG